LKLIIQGVYFDKSSSYPIGIKQMHQEKFILNWRTRELDPNQPIYIHDDETDTYHEIRTTAYKVTLPQGENKLAFHLRFTDKTLAVKENRDYKWKW
jgi:hypothetical protein